MNAELRTGDEALSDVRGEWNSLLAQSTLDSVFLTWEWVQSWRETLGSDAQPVVITVRDDHDRLCGLLPLYRRKYCLLGAVGLRGLRVMGDGVSGGEYGGVIARRDVEAAATAAILQCLAQSSLRWDMTWIPNTGPTQRNSDGLLAAAQQRGLRFRTRPAEFSHIPLPDVFEAYLHALPPKIRYQMRRSVERTQKEHGAVLAGCEGEGAVETALADLWRLHELRWSRRGQSGTFTDPRKRAFYLAMARAMFRAGWLRLDFLQVAGAPIAAQIGFAYHGVFYELQRGFDPSFPKVSAGVGAALRCLVIRRCIADGIRTYDFLGERTEDKRRAGAAATIGRDILLCGPTVRGALLARANVWPTGRYLAEDQPQPSPAPSGHVTHTAPTTQPSAALA